MVFVFQRAHVTASGRGFMIGQELPDGVLTKEQIDRRIADGILLQVFSKESFVKVEPATEVDDEEDYAPLNEVEALDPEKKSRKARK